MALFNKKLKLNCGKLSSSDRSRLAECFTMAECKEIDKVYARMVTKDILKESKDGKLAKLIGVKGGFLR